MKRWDAVRMGMLSAALVAGAGVGAEERRPRVFVPDSDSWSFGGGFALDTGGGVGQTQGGAKPQTAEIVKTIHDRCSEAIVTMKEEAARAITVQNPVRWNGTSSPSIEAMCWRISSRNAG